MSTDRRRPSWLACRALYRVAYESVLENEGGCRREPGGVASEWIHLKDVGTGGMENANRNGRKGKNRGGLRAEGGDAGHATTQLSLEAVDFIGGKGNCRMNAIARAVEGSETVGARNKRQWGEY